MKSIHVGQYETLEDVPEQFKGWAEVICECQKLSEIMQHQTRIKYVGLALKEMIDKYSEMRKHPLKDSDLDTAGKLVVLIDYLNFTLCSLVQDIKPAARKEELN